MREEVDGWARRSAVRKERNYVFFGCCVVAWRRLVRFATGFVFWPREGLLSPFLSDKSYTRKTCISHSSVHKCAHRQLATRWGGDLERKWWGRRSQHTSFYWWLPLFPLLANLHERNHSAPQQLHIGVGQCCCRVWCGRR